MEEKTYVVCDSDVKILGSCENDLVHILQIEFQNRCQPDTQFLLSLLIQVDGVEY